MPKVQINFRVRQEKTTTAMKNKITYPPKILFSVSAEFYDLVLKKLGDCDSEILDWAAVSLLHFSYLNEHVTGVNKNFITTLGSLGATFIRLALFDVAHENTALKTVYDYNQFTTSVEYKITESFFDEFTLEKFALVSKGAVTTPNIKWLIGKQFFGSLLICYGYDNLKPIVRELAQEISSKQDNLDYKTILQEYTQGKKLRQPIYEVIQELGPEHDKTFVIKVSTIDGKFAKSEGKSKSQSQKNAAKEYIKKFAPLLLKKNLYPSETKKAERIFPPIPTHEEFTYSLCKMFNVPREKAWMFSQSLVHPSFLTEVKEPHNGDNRKLAQIGSKVIESYLTLKFAILSFQSSLLKDVRIEQYRSILTDPRILVDGYESLHLYDGVLKGKGSLNEFEENIWKHEMFQAVMGAAFKASGTWSRFLENMPVFLENWFESKLNIIEDTDSLNQFDPVSGLQVFLQAIKLNWEYKHLLVDINRQIQYMPQVSLQSNITAKKFLLKSEKKFVSKKLAMRHIAKIALTELGIVNSQIGASRAFEDFNEIHQFASFILDHLLSFEPNRDDIIRWKKLGVLGSDLLAEGKIHEFKLWAIAASNLIHGTKISSGILSLYSSISQVSETEQIEQKSSLVSVSKFVENLSPESNDVDIKLVDEFDKIVKLSKIFKLLSQKWGMVKPQQLVDDLSLLRRNRFPELRFLPKIPDVVILEKEGVYQTIFLHALEVIEKINPAYKDVVLSVLFEFEEQKSTLTITFTSDAPFISRDKFLSYLNSDILWRYLSKEAAISELYANDSRFSVITKVLLPGNTFASQALDAYKMQNLLAKTENQITSQLLHDLKNQLVAYQVSLDMSGKDRTSMYKYKYEASQHRDNALTICHSLETVSSSMASPKIEVIDIGEFIRQYISEKLSTLPLNIRLETPKSTGSSTIYTSRSFLKSIFENLTKNAVEAMPDGGEIGIDWLYDEAGELLMVDISDTGIGLPTKMTERIKSGKVVDSTKHKGSGIGILSVQSMVERLGGKCTISSSSGKGTQWNITLPSMPPKEPISVKDNDELPDNFAVSIGE